MKTKETIRAKSAFDALRSAAVPVLLISALFAETAHHYGHSSHGNLRERRMQEGERMGEVRRISEQRSNRGSSTPPGPTQPLTLESLSTALPARRRKHGPRHD